MQIKIDEFGIVIVGAEIYQRIQECGQEERRLFSIGCDFDTGQIAMVGLNNEDYRRFTVIITEKEIEDFKRSNQGNSKLNVISSFAEAVYRCVEKEAEKIYTKRIASEIYTQCGEID